MAKFPILKTPKRRMFKLWHNSNSKRYQKKMVKVEEGEEDEDEESKEN
jgi:hypothetical protein